MLNTKEDNSLISVFDKYIEQSGVYYGLIFSKDTLVKKNMVESEEILLKKINEDTFDLIKERLFENSWLDLFYKIAFKVSGIYKDYFSKRSKYFHQNISQAMIETFEETNHFSFSYYIDYNTNDIITKEGKKNVTYFWTFRNCAKALNNSYPEMINKIYQFALSNYAPKLIEKYVEPNNFKNNYTELDDIQKSVLLNSFLIKLYKNNSFNYEPLSNLKDVMPIILKNAAGSNSEGLYEAITQVLYLQSILDSLKPAFNNYYKIMEDNLSNPLMLKTYNTIKKEF
ncbi:MAG: hypothetical protein ACOCP8_00025 [archaeon]